MITFNYSKKYTFKEALRSTFSEQFYLKSSKGIFYNSSTGYAEYIIDDLVDKITYGDSGLVLLVDKNKIIVGFANVKETEKAKVFEINIDKNEDSPIKAKMIIDWYSKITSKSNTIFVYKSTKAHDDFLESLNANINLIPDKVMNKTCKSLVKSLSLTQKMSRLSILLVFFSFALGSAYYTNEYFSKIANNNDTKTEELSRKARKANINAGVISKNISDIEDKIKNLKFDRYSYKDINSKNEIILKNLKSQDFNNLFYENKDFTKARDLKKKNITGEIKK